MATHPGDVHRVQATFKVGGASTQPGTLKVQVRRPGSAPPPVEYTFPHAYISNPTPGTFVVSIPVDVDGVWRGAFIGTDPAPGVEPFSFVVDPVPAQNP